MSELSKLRSKILKYEDKFAKIRALDGQPSEEDLKKYKALKQDEQELINNFDLSSLEQEFLNARCEFKKELSLKSEARDKLLEEMTQLSEKYGIPFVDEDDTYIPETYSKWEVLAEDDEDFWYEHGFEEDFTCYDIGWNVPRWKSSHC